MCIVCNMTAGDDFYAGGEKADRFLNAFERSRMAMEEATEAMLVCSRDAPREDDRKRYDHIHKQMARQLREWNRLEEKREHH